MKITITIDTENDDDYDDALGELARELKVSTKDLRHAVAANQPGHAPHNKEFDDMAKQPMKASPILQTLADQVAATTTVIASAVALINGIGARIDAAVQAAIGNGATEAELAPVQAEADALKASSQALADAVTANTPPTPTP